MQNNIGCISECTILPITSVCRMRATDMLAEDVFDMVPLGVLQHSEGVFFSEEEL